MANDKIHRLMAEAKLWDIDIALHLGISTKEFNRMLIDELSENDTQRLMKAIGELAEKKAAKGYL